MTLLSHGKLTIPPSVMELITYHRVNMPGASIVIHPILPGRLNLLFADVLPIPYHETTHCSRVNWRIVLVCRPMDFDFNVR